jgi:hypothetical protein
MLPDGDIVKNLAASCLCLSCFKVGHGQRDWYWFWGLIGCDGDINQSQDNVISTPELKGTILPGVTRKSIIELAHSRGYEVYSPQLIAVSETVRTA